MSQQSAPGASGLETLVSLSESRQRICELLYSFAPQAISLGASTFEFGWEYAPAPLEPAYRLRLAVGPHRYEFVFASADFLSDAIGIPLVKLPSVTRTTLLVEAATALIGSIEAAIGARVEIDTLVFPDDAAPAPVASSAGPAFRIVPAANRGASISGVVDCSDSALTVLAQFWQNAGAARRPAAADPALRLRFVLGSTELSKSELAETSIGDLLLIRKRTTHQGRLQVRIADDRPSARRLMGIVDGEKVTVVSEENETAVAEVAAAPAAQQGVQLDQLPMQIEFHLGTQSMTLAELEKVQPGFVFRLEQPVTQAVVSISANGRLLGHGQLVALGDVLGIRITGFVQHA